MKKDLFLKRLYCTALAALFIYSIVKQWQNMLDGRGLNSSIIISGIGLIAAGYYFFHPEKIEWKDVAQSHRIGFAVFLNVGCGLLCLFYLFFGIKTGWPENWKILSAVTGLLSVGGFMMLPFERNKKKK